MNKTKQKSDKPYDTLRSASWIQSFQGEENLEVIGGLHGHFIDRMWARTPGSCRTPSEKLSI